MPLSSKTSSFKTSKTKRDLIAKAHALNPVVIIGQKGFTKAICLETDEALKIHELIKIRINADSKEDRLIITQNLSRELNATCLKIIGHIAIFYRENSEPENLD